MASEKRAKKRNQALASPAEERGLLAQTAPAGILLLLAFVVYAPALGAGFIWDDGRAITDNLDLRSVGGLWNIWAGQNDFDYLPLKSSLLWLLYQLFGPATPPYHVFNVAIHGINAVLLWRVLRRLQVPGAYLAGLLFLVHPTHVESVAWVSECKNTLSTMFGLFSLLAWFRYQREHRGGPRVVSLVLFVCGLLCKSHLVILPLVLVLCWWWQREAPHMKRFSRRAFARSVVPFFLVAVLFGAVTVWFQNTRAIAAFQLPIGGPASRVANAGKAVWWYLGKATSPVHPWYEMPERPIETMPEALAVLAGTRTANPAPALPWGKLTTWPLCAIYRQWRVTTPAWYDFIPAAAIAALFFAIAVKRNGRGKGVFFASSYFLVALSPVLGLVKMSYMRAAWVADHFQYLADIGIIALGCAGGTLLVRRLSPLRQRLLFGATALLVTGFAAMSFARASDFRGEYSLWSDTVAKNPYAWQAHGRLGAALLARNQLDAAAVHFAEEVRLSVDNPDGHNNLGLALIAQGKVSEGIEHLRASLRINDQQFVAHANLADALAGQKKYAEAAAEYRNAIRWNPSIAPLYFRLATVLLEAGQLDEAIAGFEKADSIAPNNSEIAAALTAARRKREAAR
jgi:protein O-mannosyl-transferase